MPDKPPIFIVTGPPGAGKTTLSRTLMHRFDFGFHVPVDDLRDLVLGGHASPIGWTDETTRQFLLAEEAACDLAIRYNDSGFAVAIDHVATLAHLDGVAARRLEGRKVVKVLLLPALAENQRRNGERDTKIFDYTVLVDVIDNLNARFRTQDDPGWIRLDNTALSVEECIEAVLAQID